MSFKKKKETKNNKKPLPFKEATKPDKKGLNDLLQGDIFRATKKEKARKQDLIDQHTHTSDAHDRLVARGKEIAAESSPSLRSMLFNRTNIETQPQPQTQTETRPNRTKTCAIPKNDSYQQPKKKKKEPKNCNIKHQEDGGCGPELALAVIFVVSAGTSYASNAPKTENVAAIIAFSSLAFLLLYTFSQSSDNRHLQRKYERKGAKRRKRKRMAARNNQDLEL